MATQRVTRGYKLTPGPGSKTLAVRPRIDPVKPQIEHHPTQAALMVNGALVPATAYAKAMARDRACKGCGYLLCSCQTTDLGLGMAEVFLSQQAGFPVKIEPVSLDRYRIFSRDHRLVSTEVDATPEGLQQGVRRLRELYLYRPITTPDV